MKFHLLLWDLNRTREDDQRPIAVSTNLTRAITRAHWPKSETFSSFDPDTVLDSFLHYLDEEMAYDQQLVPFVLSTQQLASFRLSLMNEEGLVYPASFADSEPQTFHDIAVILTTGAACSETKRLQDELFDRYLWMVAQYNCRDEDSIVGVSNDLRYYFITGGRAP